MIGNIPRLETSRLVLDAHRGEDFEALAAMWSEPEVTRHTVGQPATQRQGFGSPTTVTFMDRDALLFRRARVSPS